MRSVSTCSILSGFATIETSGKPSRLFKRRCATQGSRSLRWSVSFGLDSYLGLGSVNSFTQGRTGDARGRTEDERCGSLTNHALDPMAQVPDVEIDQKTGFQTGQSEVCQEL